MEPGKLASTEDRHARTDALFCAVLIGMTILVYRKILRLWWMFDDPFHLNILKGFSVWTACIIPIFIDC